MTMWILKGVAHSAIIDRDLWKRIRLRLTRAAELHSQDPRHTGLPSGLHSPCIFTWIGWALRWITVTIPGTANGLKIKADLLEGAGAMAGIRGYSG